MTTPIDRSRYFFVPRTTGRRLLALARLLVKHKPEDASFDAEECGKLLDTVITRLTEAYVQRHREGSSLLASEETALDQVADHLWAILDDRLEHWQVFARPGVARLAALQEPGKFDYANLVEKARLAFATRRHLLAEGLDFTRRPYAEQAEYMLTLWKVIEKDQLEGQLVKLVGDDFVGALRDIHDHYLAMVEQRAIRAQGSTVNLRDLSMTLQRAIQNYLITLLAMIRDDDPDNVAMIRSALRPIDALREQLERERARGQGEPPVESAETTAAVEELIAEEQQLAAQIGIDEPEPEPNTP